LSVVAENKLSKKDNWNISKKRQHYLFIACFIIPTFVLFCMFTVYPIIRAIYLSFFDWNGTSSFMKFIKFDNYKNLFQDGIMLRAVLHDYFLVFWKVLLIMIMATYFAVALTRLKIAGRQFFRSVFFFPNVVSVVVIGVLWRFIYNPHLGFLNSFISLFTGKPSSIAWLGDRRLALGALVAPSVWAGIGFFMILLISGITSIPSSVFESAYIDGAGEWRQFWSITFPMIWVHIRVSILLIVITTLNGSFLIVSLMTEGGPDNSTQVMGYYLYQMGFKQFHMGYASTIGVAILVISMLTVGILQIVLGKEDTENS